MTLPSKQSSGTKWLARLKQEPSPARRYTIFQELVAETTAQMRRRRRQFRKSRLHA